jgi:hypothetical protein
MILTHKAAIIAIDKVVIVLTHKVITIITIECTSLITVGCTITFKQRQARQQINFLLTIKSIIYTLT